MQNVPVDNLQTRPTLAYVVGTSDCGSTLLAFVLDSHPMICALGEPPKRAIRRRGEGFVCSCGDTIERCDFWQALFGTLAERGFLFSGTVWPNDFHYLNDVANKLLAKYQPSAPRRAVQRALARVLPAHRRKASIASRSSLQFVREALARTGSQVFLETSKDLFRLEQLRQIEDWNLKVIRMVRDVRWFAYTKRQRLDPAAAARQWRAHVLLADDVLKSVPLAQQTLVRYEDLCTHPSDTARALHRFLGVPECEPPVKYDPARHHILGDGISGPFTIATAESWRTGLADHEQSVAIEIAGDLNRRFGYV
jgi:hypothetical protein